MNKALSILYLENDRNDVKLAGSTLGSSGLVFEGDYAVREHHRTFLFLNRSISGDNPL